MSAPDFRQVQREFAAHLRDPANNPAPGNIEERRLAIYRELFFNNVKVPKSHVLGGEAHLNRGFICLMEQLPWERLQIAITAVAASQAAIERLGAKKDGIIRGHFMRRDGTIRDTVMYSMRSGEWPEAKAQLLYSLNKPRD